MKAALPLIALLGSLFVSCTMFSESETIVMHPPQLPPEMRAVLGSGSWAIEIESFGVRIATLEIGEDSSFATAVPRGETCVVTGKFKGENGSTFPVGAVYPLDLEGGSVYLDFGRGFDAMVLSEAMKRGIRPETFNVIRFRAEREKRCPDPWLADIEALASAISGGDFRSDMIKPESVPKLTIHSCTGTFVSNNTFNLNLVPDAENRLILPVPRRGIVLFGETETIGISYDPSGEPLPVRRPLSQGP